MESNTEVMELLHPLMESMSTVCDVGCLLKQLCEHWQLERKIALVQQVLLSHILTTSMEIKMKSCSTYLI